MKRPRPAAFVRNGRRTTLLLQNIGDVRDFHYKRLPIFPPLGKGISTKTFLVDFCAECRQRCSTRSSNQNAGEGKLNFPRRSFTPGLLMLFAFLIVAFTANESETVAIGSVVGDFALRDADGKVHRLSDSAKADATVVVFLGTECPLARLYAPRLARLVERYKSRGVQFFAINPHQSEVEADLLTFEREYKPSVRLLRDAGQIVADRCGATRTPEAVVLDRSRRIRYRGRIDDQYTFDTHRSSPTCNDLESALNALLAGEPIKTAEVAAEGCPIDRAKRPPGVGAKTWSEHAAAVIARRCSTCHREGQIGPFPLVTYSDARKHAAGISEAVNDLRMPPWSATGAHGVFANDARLTTSEKETLLAWIDGGCPEGDPAAMPTIPDAGWSIPKPDRIVSMPVEFEVPAEWVVDYQEFDVSLDNSEDLWVSAVEIRAGVPAVVHHCSVFLKPAGAKTPKTAGSLGSFCLATTTQSKQFTVLPPGMAKRIPAGWVLSFTLHYTPIGKPVKDRTSVGLVLADPNAVKQEVATMCLLDDEMVIPPHTADYRMVKSWTAPADVVILSLFPHMHLRGKSFTYEAIWPDGNVETLLEVPRFDYTWQHRYEFTTPRRFPKGTTIRCTGVYDNSSANSANPDPSATVHIGKQAWDEMFNGYFDWAIADQDLVAERHPARVAMRIAMNPISVLCLFVALVLFVRKRFAIASTV
jgi:peroxiredoxin